MANEVRIEVTSRDRSGAGMQSARRRADELGQSTKRVGEIASGIIAAGIFERLASAATAAFTSTIRAASGLEQAVGGTEAVFGDASGAIDDFASRSADAAGLSEREFREMATLVGGQLKRMTGDVTFAGDASIRLTQIAADLAATYGGTTKDAMDAFAAALRGEADPAERFNLNLKVSAVNAKAVELGLAATTNEVDDAAKAQAIMALITEQAADAQGQFAREGDTAAVSQQKMTAAIENAQATIGQALLPVLAQAASLVADVAGAFGDLPGPVQAAIAVVGALAAGLLILAPRALAAKVALKEMGVTGDGVTKSVRSLTAGLGLLAGALALRSLIDELTKSMQESATGAGEMSLALAELRQGEVNEVIGDLVTKFRDMQEETPGEWVRDQLLGPFSQGKKEAEEFGAELAVVDTVLTEMVTGGNIQGAADTVAALGEQLGLTGDELAALVEEHLPQYVDALAGAAAQQQDTADSTAGLVSEEELLTAATDRATKAYDDATQALADYADQQRATTDPVFALIDATQTVTEKQNAYNEAVKEYGQNSPEATAAALDLASAVSDAEQAALDGDLAFDDFDAKLRAWVRQGVLTEGQADSIRDSVNGARGAAERYEGDYAADLKIRRDRAAERAAQARLNQIAADRRADMTTRITGGQRTDSTLNHIARDRTVDFFIETHRFPGVPYLASGGISGAARSSAQGGGPRGNRVLVGEQRPEVVELPFGSRVIPSVAQASDRGQGGFGGVTGPIHIRLTLDVDGQSVFAQMLRETFRTNRVAIQASDGVMVEVV